jgi:spore maturation protein CgeB
MTPTPLRFVVLGLSITSSWGNGHATTYRSLLRALAALGHDVLFLERDMPWYAGNRDMPAPPFCRTELYHSVGDLKTRFAGDVASADVVIVGSYVPEGIAVGEWVTATATGVTAFYDIDTPVTLEALDDGSCTYVTPDLVGRYRLYLSFTGGPALEHIERAYGSPAARPLYCSFDPDLYHARGTLDTDWDLGYMGTWSADRQPTLSRLLVDVARRWGGGRFTVAGAQYPATISWPSNVERFEHLPPNRHRDFYRRQRFTLNLTRSAMVRAGHAPSVRLFEAAACGTPIISDRWDGLDTFFTLDSEILVARSARDVLAWLVDLSEADRTAIGRRGRERVLREHTAAHRAHELVDYIASAASIQTAH